MSKNNLDSAAIDTIHPCPGEVENGILGQARSLILDSVKGVYSI